MYHATWPGKLGPPLLANRESSGHCLEEQLLYYCHLAREVRPDAGSSGPDLLSTVDVPSHSTRDLEELLMYHFPFNMSLSRWVARKSSPPRGGTQSCRISGQFFLGSNCVEFNNDMQTSFP